MNAGTADGSNPSRQCVKTTCPYCGVGCGVAATVDEAGNATIAGDPDHPANFGRLCSKGAALAETLDLDGRLLRPWVDGRPASWETALDLVARRFAETIAEHGPDSVAFYVSGQCLTEDYYVANKLMKGFIGSANIDTNSRLCMASTVAGHRRAFGSDTVPGCYTDLEQADLVVLVGSNLAWCHPVLFQRLVAARAARPAMRIVAIDPRRTVTAEEADLHLAIRPNSDAALFNGLLAHLADTGAVDRAFLAAHTEGFDQALAATRGLAPAALADATGLDPAAIARFYALFRETRRVVTVFSQGVNQSTGGTDKVNAILNCHLATGRIGRPGTGPFSVTGQPNAMGGREVGGLANQLAAHMEIENPAHRDVVRRFWNAPRLAERPGLKAVELFQAIEAGRVKAVWIMCTNPADSLPEADRVVAALRACPFVVVSEAMADTDTTRLADVLLPAAAWGEKDGTVTNSERRISRQRAFRRAPGEARPDWWALTRVACRLGFADAFPYRNAAEIFREHAALSEFDNDGSRDFDIGPLVGLSDAAYDAMAPVQWPVRDLGDTGLPDRRLFGDGRFFTPSGKARLIPIAAPQPVPMPERMFVLNTGRVRDHWHTLTRTGLSPRLTAHLAEPFAEIHPDDAHRLGASEAGLLRIKNSRGAILVRALVTDRVQPGSVFVPMHWTDRFASAARVDAVVPADTDPISGQPGSKAAAVRVEAYRPAWYGFAVLAERPRAVDATYWALAKVHDGWKLELADAAPVSDWPAWVRTLMGIAVGERSVDLLAYRDAEAGIHRFAAFRNDRLIGALFVGPDPVAVSRGWAAERLGDGPAEPRQRFAVLAGRAGGDSPDPGAIVCSCFAVGANRIAAAVTGQGCASVDEIGAVTNAGTNCGSCRSEIQRILDHVRRHDATLEKAG
ncbi:nitrate reductase [Thalassobaculum fulvum]|uniref:Nitrate reductase n=1 Tax=Thalassobaculum fulvum TaxID=1633335 RepID=A0A918XXD5_9PROT|nr:nitrate reductase [Thalassobaculum fulvum]GHD62469.1 nitrate reductase [Thalassobaculum fulvum]